MVTQKLVNKMIELGKEIHSLHNSRNKELDQKIEETHKLIRDNNIPYSVSYCIFGGIYEPGKEFNAAMQRVRKTVFHSK